MSPLHTDIPATSPADDRLDRAGLIDRLIDLLVEGKGENRRSTRVVAGLTGSWGAGKSSIMGRLSERLSSMSNVIVVSFNPWLVGEGEQNVHAFLSALKLAVSASNIDDRKALTDAFERYREALDPVLKETSPLGHKLASIIPRRPKKGINELRADLEIKLKSLDAAVVVLIDELDRVEDREVRAMARTIKAIGDLPNISYLIAFDRERVTQALGEQGTDYIKKIVQFTVSIRPMMDYEVRVMLVEQLQGRGYSDDLGDKVLFEQLMEILAPILHTPRDIKRIISSFYAIEPAVHDEINPIDILAYATLSAQEPGFRDFIERNVDKVVNDPSLFDEISDRSSIERDALREATLGKVIHQEFSPLVQFVFPFLADDGPDEIRFGRIQERQNLLALLYLGDPPFRLSRRSVVRMWENPDTDQLLEFGEAGLLEDFMWQSVKLMDVLPKKNDKKVWKSIALFLASDHAMLSASGRQYLRVARAALIQAADRHRERVLDVLRYLRASKDLMLSPNMLRYHMFAYGLVKGIPARHGPTIFDESETRHLMKAEVERYRTSLGKRAWTSKGASPDFFYAIEQVGRFDRGARSKLALQLRSKAAALTFAVIMTPPGTSSDPGVLHRLVDVSKVLPHLKMMLAPVNEWRAASLENLIAGLSAEPDAAEGRSDVDVGREATSN